jgi:hypothetical protein
MATATDEFVVSFRAEGAQELEKAFRTTSSAASEAGDRVKSTTQSFSRYRSATDSVLEGQRRVQTNLKNLALDLSTSTSATDALRTGALRLSEVFKIGIIPAVAIGGGALAFGKINEQVKATVKAFDVLQSELRRPFFQEAALGADALTTELANISKATDDLIKKRNSYGGRLNQTFARGRDDVGESIAAGRKREQELTAAIADSELRIVAARGVSLEISAHQGALLKIQLDEQERLSKLYLDNALTKPGRDATTLFRRDAGIRQDARLQEAAENRRAAQEKESVDHAEVLADIQKEGLSTLDETIQKLQEEVLYRQNLVALAGNEEEKAQALANVSQAQANLLKFAREAAFQQSVNLSYARAATDSIKLQLNHQEILGDAVEKRASAELKIKQLLHDGQIELAGQIALQEQLNSKKAVQTGKESLVMEQAQENLKSPNQKFQDLNQNNQLYEQVRSESYRRGIAPPEPPRYGEAYHPFQPSQDQQFNELNQAQDMSNQDFSGVSALAGQDFSGVATLAGLDFSGIEALSNLSITIE